MRFSEMGLKSELLRGLEAAGFSEAFEIQIHAIPPALKGRDVIGKAQSGSGKTLAFLIPLLNEVERGRRWQALILAPTRELAIQIAEVADRIGGPLGVRTVVVYGGRSIDVQARQLQQAEIIVATPGRLIDHAERRTVNLGGIRMVVLDEADRMLDMGFIEDIDWILRQTPRERQTLLFSATMPREIAQLAGRYMRGPVTVERHKEAPTVPTVEHLAYIALDGDKVGALRTALREERPEQAIIFVGMKVTADRLAGALYREFPVDVIHGDLTQTQREKVLSDFRKGKVKLMIATDVAARGLDIPAVSHIFNFDLPLDIETFIHRVGRTGRAGARGRAIHIAVPTEHNDLAVIEHFAKVSIPRKDYRGKIAAERAAEMRYRLEERQAIIPKWTKRAGGPRRGRGWPRRGGFGRGGPPRRR